MLGSDASAILAGTGAFAGYFAGRAIDASIRGRQTVVRDKVNQLDRAVFAVAALVCLAATVASVRWFVHSAKPEALSAAALAASWAATIVPVACASVFDIRSVGRVYTIANVVFAAISLYALAEKPSTLSIVASVWCVYVAAVLMVAYLKGVRSGIRR